MQTILALDQGTTSSRAILFDERGRLLHTAQQEFTQHFPQPGHVEHDANEIGASQLAVARQVIDAADDADSIAALGITNQRETVVVWDRQTGEPIGPALVWQDRRTADACHRLIEAGHAQTIRAKTGLVVDAYFSATKLRWLLDHIDGARAKAERGEVAFGTVDSWLIYRLTAGKVHATDASNASRTMLFNLHTQRWDDELLELFDIPASVMPGVRDSSGDFGVTDPSLFGRPFPIRGVAGDQQAALFGQMCTEPGQVKTTYGTGCFMLLNVGTQPIESKHRLLSTVAWRFCGETTYALEGSVFIGGATVQWLRDGLGIIDDAAEIEALAASVPDSGGVVLVPAFAGLGAPHWDQYARGLVAGITRGTTRAHLARAALEGIAFQVADVLDVMRQDYGRELKPMRVDGGAAANDLLMQLQSDLSQSPLIRPTVTETTALGAAYLAGLGAGVWADVAQIKQQWQQAQCFEPQVPADESQARRTRWLRAVERAGEWETVDS
jgi:glycerol kinase